LQVNITKLLGKDPDKVISQLLIELEHLQKENKNLKENIKTLKKLTKHEYVQRDHFIVETKEIFTPIKSNFKWLEEENDKLRQRIKELKNQ